MNFKIIDRDKWSRKETFEHFSTVAKSTYSLTVKVDVTNIVEQIKQGSLRFYPIFTWIVTKALNQFEQFKMGYDAEGRLGYYSCIHPMYSVMDKENNVVSLCTEYTEEVCDFYKRMAGDLENFEKEGYAKENDKYVIPLALQVSHAVADGYHCAQFYETVEQLIHVFSTKNIIS